jgi:hypothetical protein
MTGLKYRPLASKHASDLLKNISRKSTEPLSSNIRNTPSNIFFQLLKNVAFYKKSVIHFPPHVLIARIQTWKAIRPQSACYKSFAGYVCWAVNGEIFGVAHSIVRHEVTKHFFSANFVKNPVRINRT